MKKLQHIAILTLFIIFVCLTWSCSPSPRKEHPEPAVVDQDSLRKRELYASTQGSQNYYHADLAKGSYTEFMRLSRKSGNGMAPILIMSLGRQKQWGGFTLNGAEYYLESTLEYHGLSTSNSKSYEITDSLFTLIKKKAISIQDGFRSGRDSHFGLYFGYYVLEYLEGKEIKQKIFAINSHDPNDPANELFNIFVTFFPPFINPTNKSLGWLLIRDTIPIISPCK